MPMPRMMQIVATRNSMPIMLPAETVSTRSVMTSPKPVIETVPTTMPAAAVAIAMPIMFRAPDPRPSTRSCQPAASRDRGELAAKHRDQRLLREQDRDQQGGRVKRRQSGGEVLDHQ